MKNKNNVMNVFYEILNSLKKDYKTNITEGPSYISIELVPNDLEEIITNYKKNIDELDDCIFVDVIDELKDNSIDLKKFDELLNKDELNVIEETYVREIIKFTNDLIKSHITKKIEKLSELINKL